MRGIPVVEWCTWEVHGGTFDLVHAMGALLHMVEEVRGEAAEKAGDRWEVAELKYFGRVAELFREVLL